MDKKVQKFLEIEGVKYEVLTHRKVYTAFNAAETQHTNPKEVVKTVLVKFDKAIAFLEEPMDKIEKFQYILAAVPSGKHVDFKKIDKLVFDIQTKLYKKLAKAYPKIAKPIKIKSKMANEKDIKERLKLKAGLLAPIEAYDLPIILDKKLTLNKNIIFSAGTFTESIKMSTKNYLKAVEPIIGIVSK